MRSGILAYSQAIQSLQEELIAEQHDLLAKVASEMAKTILRGQCIFLFGTGHSHMLAEEGHFRAGGLAPVVPILFPALMLHDGSLLSGKIERLAGIAETLLDRYGPVPGEMLFVFSNSGVNQIIVEIALTAKARQLMVVAVCSMAYARVAPLSPVGKRLYEVADYTIDNGGEPGDSIVQLEDTPLSVGSTSTVIGALLWNCLVTETCFQLKDHIDTLPVYLSANMPGAAEHNSKLLETWRNRNPHI